MTTFENVTYHQFRGHAAEFFRATQDRSAITPEQAENGNKALGLLYLGGTDDWTDQQINSAVIILNLAMKRCIEVALSAPDSDDDDPEEQWPPATATAASATTI